MEYFNTYYFCSLIQFLVEDACIDYARTLAEFKNLMSGSERIDFTKESYLHSFVEFVVERVLFEQNKYMASDVGEAIEEDGYANVIKENHKVFYGNCLGGYIFTTFELDIMYYSGSAEKMNDLSAQNIAEDEYDYLDVASQYTEYLEDNYYDIVDGIKRRFCTCYFRTELS